MDIALDYEVTEQKEALYEAIAAQIAGSLRLIGTTDSGAPLLHDKLCCMWNSILGADYTTREEIAALCGAYFLARDLLNAMQEAPPSASTQTAEELAAVTPAEFSDTQDVLIRILTAGRTPAEQPEAHLIAGQPGAGKTTMADLFARTHASNIIFLSGDAYRPFHPRFHELHVVCGDDVVRHTANFAGKMTESLIDALSERGYHLIIEGTLRTRETPLNTRERLAARGYRVTLNILAVPPLLSYLATLRRYRRMQEFGMIPRHTPRAHHDLVVRDICANLEAIEGMHAFDAIRLYDRTGACLTDTGQTDGSSPADLLRRVMSRPITDTERADLRRTYAPYIPHDLLTEALSIY